jgi:hypothetical protein
MPTPLVAIAAPFLLTRNLSHDELAAYLRKHYYILDGCLLPHVTGQLLLDMHCEGMDIIEICPVA